MRYLVENRAIPRSTGCQPVGSGSVPKGNRPIRPGIEMIFESGEDVAGRLPTTAGWQLAIPRQITG
jgi:hypothetical protein